MALPRTLIDPKVIYLEPAVRDYPGGRDRIRLLDDALGFPIGLEADRLVVAKASGVTGTDTMGCFCIRYCRLEPW